MKYPLIKNNIERSDLDPVIDLLKTDNPILTNGPKVREFEEKWSRWLGVKYSVFVNSGSSANLLSLSLLKIKYPNGGEVIVPPFTWVSDIASVIQCGFEPVFVDISLNTLGMQTKKIIEKINSNTRAVFLSHIQGFNALDDELIMTLKAKNIHLIEDVCESHGAEHNKMKVGTFGWTSNFSFYYAHHMSTIEGGMICTDDFEAYENLRMLRSHGMVRETISLTTKKNWEKNHSDLNPKFIFAYPSYNVRNNEIGALIGLSQLNKLDYNIKKRNENHYYFLDQLDKKMFFIDFNLIGSSNYAFNLILKNKDNDLIKRIQNNLSKNEIEYRLGSAGGGNQLRQPYLKNYIRPSIKPDQFKNTDHIHFYGLYIGNYPELDKSDIDFIVSVINQ